MHLLHQWTAGMVIGVLLGRVRKPAAEEFNVEVVNVTILLQHMEVGRVLVHRQRQDAATLIIAQVACDFFGVFK